MGKRAARNNRAAAQGKFSNGVLYYVLRIRSTVDLPFHGTASTVRYTQRL